MATHKGFTASQRVSKNAGLIVPVGAALGLFLDPLVNVQTLCPRSPGQELLNTSATFGAGDVQCVLRAVLLVRQAWPGPLDQFGVPPVGCTRRRCITGFRLEQGTVERAYIWMHRLKQPWRQLEAIHTSRGLLLESCSLIEHIQGTKSRGAKAGGSTTKTKSNYNAFQQRKWLEKNGPELSKHLKERRVR